MYLAIRMRQDLGYFYLNSHYPTCANLNCTVINQASGKTLVHVIYVAWFVQILPQLPMTNKDTSLLLKLLHSCLKYYLFVTENLRCLPTHPTMEHSFLKLMRDFQWQNQCAAQDNVKLQVDSKQIFVSRTGSCNWKCQLLWSWVASNQINKLIYKRVMKNK